MTTQNMVVGLPKSPPPTPDGVYRGCVLGKHHQAPFESGKVWKAQNLLELVHSDICCINIPSLACERYIFNFIDDMSRFTSVYFLKIKNYVFEKFKEFRAFTKKQCGRPIK
jgi:hypothetical protein